MNEESADVKKLLEEAFQKRLGLTMALIATIFSITGWIAGKYSAAQSGAEQKVAYMHEWYNAKGIKQSLAEAQGELLKALLDSGTISQDKIDVLGQNIKVTNANIARYKKEKAEMTLGSKVVGKENWVQDIDGKLGQVLGTKELEHKVARLEPAIGRFQMSYLFFQLSLFVGSVSLMHSNLKMKHVLFRVLAILGMIGLGLAANGWIIAAAAL